CAGHPAAVRPAVASRGPTTARHAAASTSCPQQDRVIKRSSWASGRFQIERVLVARSAAGLDVLPTPDGGMAAGTHTRFLVGLMLLVNALVLLNIRRASPELPRAAQSHRSAGGSRGGASRDVVAGGGAADKD
ncbi:unnamed protein product, partial [Scytosiphon promiscuus]